MSGPESPESNEPGRPVPPDARAEPLKSTDGAAALPDAFRTALSTLETGDFGAARTLFGELIQEFPDDLEYLCGYYSAGWWFNREEQRSGLKDGRAKGDWFMQEWDAFQRIADERDYAACLSFRASMRAILREAAEQYRIAFQEEGAAAVDTTLLKTLAICLMRLEDYADAAEILMYARRRQSKGDATLCFLLGEALCSQKRPEQMEKGLSYYRDALLIDPHAVDPGLMASEPATSVFADLYTRFEQNIERCYQWFPAYLHAHLASHAGLRALSQAELQHLRAESQRLAGDLETVVEKYRDKVRATLGFLYLCLIHHYRHHMRDRTSARQIEDRLKSVVPEVYTLHREHSS